ncbi:MAG: GGDEF domain-containing protein, partial [Leptothrix sp. (in: b-proteobacteria)]
MDDSVKPAPAIGLEARVALENLRRALALGASLWCVSLVLGLVVGAALQPQPAGWRTQMITTYAGVAVNLLLVGTAWRLFRRRVWTNLRWLHAAEWWALASVVLIGLPALWADPAPDGRFVWFGVGCVLTGACLLLQPWRAALLFTLAWAALSWLLSTHPALGAHLPRQRTDGAIAALLAWIVSWVGWHRHLRHEALAHDLLQTRQALRERDAAHAALVVRDPLTQTWTRAELMRLTQRELSRAQRQGGETCLVLVEVDAPERWREQGDSAGFDRMMVVLAAVLRDAVRNTDELARDSHARYAVLLPQTGADEARQLAERLRLAVSALRLKPSLQSGDAGLAGRGLGGVSGPSGLSGLGASTGSAGSAPAAAPAASAPSPVHLAVACQPGRALVPVPQQIERLFAAAEAALAQSRQRGGP